MRKVRMIFIILLSLTVLPLVAKDGGGSLTRIDDKYLHDKITLICDLPESFNYEGRTMMLGYYYGDDVDVVERLIYGYDYRGKGKFVMVPATDRDNIKYYYNADAIVTQPEPSRIILGLTHAKDIDHLRKLPKVPVFMAICSWTLKIAEIIIVILILFIIIGIVLNHRGRLKERKRILQRAVAFAMPIIDKYYHDNPQLKKLLMIHSEKVAKEAISIILYHNLENCVDVEFVAQAAMLHDIGIVECDAPSIFCHGTHPYICHGTIGRAMLEKEGLPRHALVCERHTGSGLTADEIIEAKLPLPHRDMLPVTIEEKLVCYADKFYSKSGNPTRSKSVNEIEKSMRKHGDGAYQRFMQLFNQFSYGPKSKVQSK